MNQILISINPEYVERIISGEKKYEFRTRIAKKSIKKIIIYCTFPKMKVMAEAEIIDILEMPPAKLWEASKEFSGISEKGFFQYFSGRDIAYAYKLGKITVYENAKALSDFGCKAAPQSFVYVS